MQHETRNVEVPDPERTVAALTHVRTFLLQEADQRGRNFNYFLIVCAAVAAALLNSANPWVQSGLLVAGVFLASAFFIIDRRNMRLILDARAELYRLEGRLGIRLHERDQVRDPAAGIAASIRNRVISLTFAYRSIYILAALACVLGLFVILTQVSTNDEPLSGPKVQPESHDPSSRPG